MKNNLRDSLFSSGLIEEGNPDKIAQFKKDYAKNYANSYQKKYDKENKRKTLIFSPKEFAFLQDKAQHYGLKLSPFLKSIIFAYLQSSFVFPDEKTLSSIEVLLREINQRVAESIQYVHMSKTLELSDIEQLKKRIQHLEFFISETLNNPPRLENWIESQVEKDDQFIAKLLQALSYHLSAKS